MRACLPVALAATCLAFMAETLPEAAPAQRYLVFFETPAAAQASVAAAPGRGAKIAALRAVAARAQAPFLAERVGVLSGRGLESNWLANALVLEMTAAEARDAAAAPGVKRVVPDRSYRIERPVPAAAGDTPEATWGVLAIRAREARAKHGVDGSGVVVGILDTGYEADHPSLAGKLLAFRDLIDGKNDVGYDDNGHGTHCAGTIGGSPDPDGMEIGVAPGARFVAGKIFNRHGYTSASAILAGMQWVVDPDGRPGTGDEPRFVSNSWGGPPGRDIFHEAVTAWVGLGVLPVFAAGNAGPRAGSVGSPGGYPECLAVAATTVETRVAQFSSRGPYAWEGRDLTKPDVAAPGQAVTSAFPGGGYRSLSGTSMATPHVAGLVALLLEKAPGLDVEDLRYVLEETAVQHGAGPKNYDWGAGLIDAEAALDLVAEPGALRRARRRAAATP